MYDRYWNNWYLPAAKPALERLFFSDVPAGCKVLDVCCGSGHVTREFVERGYRVTGVDSSSALIEIARSQLPDATFVVQDVRRLEFKKEFDAAVSTFDSLNHLLTLQDLQATFCGARAALKPSGLFVFDMNLEDAWRLDLHTWTATVNDDSVSLVRGSFDAVEKLATTELVWFVPNGSAWERRTSIVQERCYTQQEILDALGNAGFSSPAAFVASEAGVTAELGYGRVFFRARA